MNYQQQLEIEAAAKRFAAHWYSRGDKNRDEATLEFLVKGILSTAFETATAGERERIAKKLAALTS